MPNPFKAIGKFFQTMFSWFSGNQAQKIAEAIKNYAIAALPVVEFIASLTPTRADDEIVDLFKRLLLPNVEAYLALPKEDRGAALMAAGLSLLQKQFPDVPVSQLRAAIELAVQAMKTK